MKREYFILLTLVDSYFRNASISRVIFLILLYDYLVAFLKIKLLFLLCQDIEFCTDPKYTGICLYFLIELLGFHF